MATEPSGSTQSPESQLPESDSSAGSGTPRPTIHAAEREGGPSGAVLRGIDLDMAAAVSRRRNGEDVVICGSDTDVNRRQTYQVEAAVGPPSRPQAPHKNAGPMSLPHFHQRSRSPQGHTFYETDKRKTKRKA